MAITTVGIALYYWRYAANTIITLYMSANMHAVRSARAWVREVLLELAL